MVGSVSIWSLVGAHNDNDRKGVKNLGYSSFSIMGLDFSLTADMVQCGVGAHPR